MRFNPSHFTLGFWNFLQVLKISVGPKKNSSEMDWKKFCAIFFEIFWKLSKSKQRQPSAQLYAAVDLASSLLVSKMLLNFSGSL